MDSRLDVRPGKAGRTDIVYLTNTFEPEVGGTVRQTANQARALRDRGFRITILTQRTRAELPAAEERGGLNVRRFGQGHGRIAELRALVQWSAWLVRHRGEVAAVQVVLHPEFLLCAAIAGLSARASILWVGRGDADRTLSPSGSRLSRPVRFVRRRVVRSAHNIVLTPHMANEVGRYTATAPSVIPVPVESGHFRPPTESERDAARRALGLSAADTLLLYTGHLDPGKGLHQLIEALGRISAPDLKLCIVGGERVRETVYAERLRSDVARLGLEDRVSFAGYVEDVRDPYLWAADVFVLPSEREGMPNAVLEAMACGLPSILPASAGGDELLTTSFGAIPADNSPDELREALEALLAARGTWPQMGRAARAAAEGYSVASVTDSYETLYRELAGRRG